MNKTNQSAKTEHRDYQHDPFVVDWPCVTSKTENR